MRRTRDEFIALHYHELLGLLVDALTCGQTGAARGLLLDTLSKRLKDRLARAYDDLARDESTLPVNGQPAPQRPAAAPPSKGPNR